MLLLSVTRMRWSRPTITRSDPYQAMTRTWETLAAFIRFERMPALGHRDAHLPCGVTLQSEGNYPSFLTGNYPSSFLSLKAVPNRDCAQLH